MSSVLGEWTPCNESFYPLAPDREIGGECRVKAKTVTEMRPQESQHRAQSEGSQAADALDAPPSHVIEGAVVEILTGLGLAHVEAADGFFYGVRRETPGVRFEALRVGQRVRCVVSLQLRRVIHAELASELSSGSSRIL